MTRPHGDCSRKSSLAPPGQALAFSLGDRKGSAGLALMIFLQKIYLQVVKEQKPS